MPTVQIYQFLGQDPAENLRDFIATLSNPGSNPDLIEGMLKAKDRLDRSGLLFAITLNNHSAVRAIMAKVRYLPTTKQADVLTHMLGVVDTTGKSVFQYVVDDQDLVPILRSAIAQLPEADRSPLTNQLNSAIDANKPVEQEPPVSDVRSMDIMNPQFVPLALELNSEERVGLFRSDVHRTNHWCYISAKIPGNINPYFMLFDQLSPEEQLQVLKKRYMGLNVLQLIVVDNDFSCQEAVAPVWARIKGLMVSNALAFREKLLLEGRAFAGVAATAVVTGNMDLFKEMLGFASSQPEVTKTKLLDDLFTGAVYRYNDPNIAFDDVDNWQLEILAAAICTGQLADFCAAVLLFLDSLDEATKIRYLEKMLCDDMLMFVYDSPLGYDNLFYFAVKTPGVEEVSIAKLITQLIDALPVENKKILLSKVFLREPKGSLVAAGNPYSHQEVALFAIAAESSEVFNLIIDCIYSLPVEEGLRVNKRRLLLRQVLQQETKARCGVFLSLWKDGSVESIDLRLIAYSGPCFLRFLEASNVYRDDDKLLLRGLYEWVTPGRFTSKPQQDLIQAWFQSASIYNRKVLAELVSSTSLYKRCNAAATKVGQVSVLTNAPPVEMQPVHGHGLVGGSGGK